MELELTNIENLLATGNFTYLKELMNDCTVCINNGGKILIFRLVESPYERIIDEIITDIDQLTRFRRRYLPD
jgi:hypothetical protein